MTTTKTADPAPLVPDASPRRSVFGPPEIARLASAYDAALAAVTDDLEGASNLGARDIRRQLAAAIMDEASRGRLDPDELTDSALASLLTRSEPRKTGT